MSEYIIAHEQIQELIERSALEAIDGYRMGVVKQIWSFPKLPEIMRCRDCESYQPGLYEHFTCEYLHRWAKPDDFCAWGERKADA